jgi:hypothetical protein
MRYLLLAYGDEQALSALPAGERRALLNACLANDDALRRSGHLLAAEGLEGSAAATTVRVHNGRLSVSDGPFASTREQIVGLFFINARDLNEAIQVAATMPQARGGPIEVRPVLELNPSGHAPTDSPCRQAE